MEEFVLAYITAALWSSTDESRPDGGDPLDKNYTQEDISAETLLKMREDCQKFYDEHQEDIGLAFAKAGHDFWLTRNGHGCGFWDGDWPKEIGQRLTEASEIFDNFDLYVGDDDIIYHFKEVKV